VEILKIPDIQKERQYYIEQGLKFLQNALLDDDFFEDALQNFLKSESIEPRDYFVLQRIGLIYYHSSKHKDLKSAEEYFLKAGKYAVASMKITEMGSPNLLQNHLDQKYYHRIDAAESYMFAGRSCYLQCKYSEAAEYSGKAFSLNPDLVEAGFTQAKSLAASNNELQAAGVLEKVIELDRFYSIRTLSDRDLCNKPPIHSLLKRLRIEATKKASDFVGDCKKKMIPDSMALKFLLQMEKLIEQNSFLTSKEVLDHCNKVQEYRFCEPFKNPTQTTKLNEIIKSIKSLSKLHYKGKNGNYIQVNEDFLDLILHEINDKTQWIFPLSQSIIKDSLNWQTQIITKTINCKIVQFIESENDYNDDLQNIVNQIYSISQKTSTEYNQWLEFSENERRKAIYAGRIADKEQHNRGILLGVIVGGVCAFIGYQSGGIGPSIITGIITFLLAYAYSRRK
jgi:tetratricopeptide (TPR) repeat protein